MHNSNKKEQSATNYIILAILVGFISIAATVAIGRSFTKRLGLNNRVINKKAQAETQLTKNIQSLANLTVEYDSLGPARTTISNALPLKADFPAVSSTMENIAKLSGVKLNSVEPALTSTAGTTKSGDGPQEFKYTIAIVSNYANLQNMMRNIEISARPQRVTNITVDGASDGLQVKLSITTYFQGTAKLSTKTEEVR